MHLAAYSARLQPAVPFVMGVDMIQEPPLPHTPLLPTTHTVTLGGEVEQGRVSGAARVGCSADLVVAPLFLLFLSLSAAPLSLSPVCAIAVRNCLECQQAQFKGAEGPTRSYTVMPSTAGGTAKSASAQATSSSSILSLVVTAGRVGRHIDLRSPQAISLNSTRRPVVVVVLAVVHNQSKRRRLM
ncbi:hypothetical protein CCH79_00013908 [Gambusia affinis]|uniref:Uncharacterized protein n=1 Tax=Gambusia affinis TaxID=33528 RepID=A0A315VWG1_GAMAF|nr:hypothetical protein CCH79_00013908 [Gambusia affinis]